MIDRLIEILGELPKDRRRSILRAIDVVSWAIIIFNFIIPLPRIFLTINLIVCTIMLMLTFRLIQIGGWWWTKDGE